MGDWSEAMEDGVICRGCALPLGTQSVSGYCPSCATQLRPKAQTPEESHLDPARKWKDSPKD